MPAQGSRPERSRDCPVVLKEEQPIAGRSMRFGSLLTEGWVAEETHPVPERVLAAGAIVHARTTTPEFCCAALHPLRPVGHHPQPVEPGLQPRWVLRRFGCCARLRNGVPRRAARTSAARSGSLPRSTASSASSRRTVGCRRCHRSTSTPTATTAPLGRTVADVALLHNVIQGQHPVDHVSLPALPIPEDLGDVRGLRIALARHARRLPDRRPRSRPTPGPSPTRCGRPGRMVEEVTVELSRHAVTSRRRSCTTARSWGPR